MTTYKRIAAVQKATEILRALGCNREPMTGAEVAKAVDLPVGTTMCHLATLEDAGFVMSVGEHWKPGMALGIIWARIRSNLETDRDRVERDMEAIGIKGDSHGVR